MFRRVSPAGSLPLPASRLGFVFIPVSFIKKNGLFALVTLHSWLRCHVYAFLKLITTCSRVGDVALASHCFTDSPCCWSACLPSLGPIFSRVWSTFPLFAVHLPSLSFHTEDTHPSTHVQGGLTAWTPTLKTNMSRGQGQLLPSSPPQPVLLQS